MRGLSKFVGLFILLIMAGVSRASAETGGLIFYLPFENSINAEIAGGSGDGQSKGGISFVEGYRDKGIKLSPGAKLSYQNQNNFNLKAGTIMFWFKPDWEKGKEGQ